MDPALRKRPNEPRFSSGHLARASQLNASTAAERNLRLQRRPNPMPARQLKAVVKGGGLPDCLAHG